MTLTKHPDYDVARAHEELTQLLRSQRSSQSFEVHFKVKFEKNEYKKEEFCTSLHAAPASGQLPRRSLLFVLFAPS